MRYRWDPVYPAGRRLGPSNDSTLRASDAERNEVADKLARHFADGRLDQPEFKARLDRAIGATTRGDLEGLFDDLPPLDSETPPAPPRRRWSAALLLVIALVAVAASAIASEMHVPWLLFVFVAVFLWHRAGRRHAGHHSHHEIGH